MCSKKILRWLFTELVKFFVSLHDFCGAEKDGNEKELNNNGDMENRSIVSIADYGKEKIQYLLDMAAEFEAHPNRQLLRGKVVATLFTADGHQIVSARDTMNQLTKHTTDELRLMPMKVLEPKELVEQLREEVDAVKKMYK